MNRDDSGGKGRHDHDESQDQHLLQIHFRSILKNDQRINQSPKDRDFRILDFGQSILPAGKNRSLTYSWSRQVL
ncbi:hypothetical protein, partial [Allochromatium palmeri]|uniref:hypothetical protein n=1 Tax=Allochromatium palmeri TaxID=231048 RepID=UPI001CA45D50